MVFICYKIYCIFLHSLIELLRKKGPFVPLQSLILGKVSSEQERDDVVMSGTILKC